MLEFTSWTSSAPACAKQSSNICSWRPRRRWRSGDMSQSAQDQNRVFLTSTFWLPVCQGPLLSDLMLLVSTVDVFGHMWRFFSSVWLFNTYAALTALPSARLRPVRETSISIQCHKSQTTELCTHNNNCTFYFNLLFCLVFINKAFREVYIWWKTAKVSQNPIKGNKADISNLNNAECILQYRISSSTGSTAKLTQTTQSLLMKVCICWDQLGLNAWDCHNLQYIFPNYRMMH